MDNENKNDAIDDEELCQIQNNNKNFYKDIYDEFVSPSNSDREDIENWCKRMIYMLKKLFKICYKL